ncbi:MAG: hypothetical protein ACI97A_002248 [Planctomycetota bacterium]
MKRNSLVFMFLLVVAAAASFAFLKDDVAPPVVHSNPLSQVDFTSIKKLTCDCQATTKWNIEQVGLSYFFASENVAGGKSVAVNTDMLGRILGFLQDARPTGNRSTDGVNLAEWGLNPPLIQLTIEDAGGIHELEIGKPDHNEDVLIRAKGSDRLFSFPSRVVADLSREAVWFRDPRLCDIPSHLTDRFDFERRGGANFSLIRTTSQWYLEFPNGERRRAGIGISNQVTVALSGLRGQPVDNVDKGLLDKPAELKVTIFGMGRKVSFDVLSLERDNILARRQDEPDFRELDASILRFIDVRPKDLEDKSLVGIDLNELASINILHPKGRPIRLQKKNRFWSLNFGINLDWSVDSIALKAFQSKLLGIKTTSRKKLTEKREFEHQVEVGFDPDLELPPVLISFSAPDDKGSRVAWRSDEDVEYTVGESAGDFLKSQYWDVMGRFVSVAVADQIDDIRIIDSDAVEWHLKRSARKENWELSDKKMNGETVPNFKVVEFPGDFMVRLLNLLSQLTVPEFVGEQSPEKIKETFSKPLYEVHWNYKQSIEMPGTDEWAPRRMNAKYLIIGDRIDDVHLRGRVSEFPALVFKIQGTALLPISDAITHLKK